MGSFWSKEKKSAQILEEIERKLADLEAYRKDTEIRQKHFVGYLLIISILLYVVVILLGYFYYYPRTLQEAAIRLTPLLLFPGLVWLLRTGVIWFFAFRIERHELRAAELRKKRKNILDEIKDKETYKVAKEILEKYDPQTKIEKASRERQEQEMKERAEIMKRSSLQQSQATALRHRMLPVPTSGGTPFGAPLRPPMGTPAVRASTFGPGFGASTSQAFGPYPPIPRLPRPILQQERGPVDKIVDYLLKDGPSNRYALICKECHSHNGMALQEEFEFLAFRCCYCYTFNPARKQKPHAPKVPEFEATNMRTSRTNSTASEPAVRRRPKSAVTEADSDLGDPSDEGGNISRNVRGSQESLNPLICDEDHRDSDTTDENPETQKQSSGSRLSQGGENTGISRVSVERRLPPAESGSVEDVAIEEAQHSGTRKASGTWEMVEPSVDDNPVEKE